MLTFHECEVVRPYFGLIFGYSRRNHVGIRRGAAARRFPAVSEVSQVFLGQCRARGAGHSGNGSIFGQILRIILNGFDRPRFPCHGLFRGKLEISPVSGAFCTPTHRGLAGREDLSRKFVDGVEIERGQGPKLLLGHPNFLDIFGKLFLEFWPLCGDTPVLVKAISPGGGRTILPSLALS